MMSLIVPLQNKLVKSIIYIITGMLIHSVGAGLVCPVLAGPPFRQFNKIYYIKNYAHASHVPITAKPFQKSFLQPYMLFKECSSLAFFVAALRQVRFMFSSCRVL